MTEKTPVQKQTRKPASKSTSCGPAAPKRAGTARRTAPVEKQAAAPTQLIQEISARPRPLKQKIIEGGLKMTAQEHDSLANLKTALQGTGQKVSKNRLLRAAVTLLEACTMETLQSALAQLPPLKQATKKKPNR